MKKQRILSLILSAELLLSLLPMQAAAAEALPGQTAGAEAPVVETMTSDQLASPEELSVEEPFLNEEQIQAESVSQLTGDDIAPLHTYAYSGDFTKNYDGDEIAAFDPALMIVDGQSGRWTDIAAEKDSHNLNYVEARWYSYTSGSYWRAESDQSDLQQNPYQRPRQPGRYALRICELDQPDAPEGIGNAMMHSVYSLDFEIKAQGTAENGVITLPMWDYLNYTEGYKKVNIGTLVFSVNPDGCTLTVTDVRHGEPSGHLVIPEKVYVGDTVYTVTALGDMAFYPKNQQKSYMDFYSIYIPATVSSIGERALASIHGKHFYVAAENPYFSSYTWETGYFGGSALYTDDYSKLVAVPSAARGTFEQCFHVGHANFAPLTEIGPYALQDILLEGENDPHCITIPDSVTTLGKGAFLQNVQIHYMGDSAPDYCTLVIGAGLTGLTWTEKDGFGLPSLQSVRVSPQNLHLQSYNDQLVLTKDGGTLLCCASAAKGEIVIPEGVHDIHRDAFKDCRNITSIHIPSTLHRLNGECFHGCSALERVTAAAGNPIYSSVDGMLLENGNTLALCPVSGRWDVVLPQSVTTVAPYAFPAGGNLGMLTFTGPRAVFRADAFRDFCCSIVTGPGTILEPMDPHTFRDAGIVSFDVQHPGPNYASTDGMLTSCDRKTLFMSFGNTKVPESIEIVDTGAFRDIGINGPTSAIEMPYVKVIREGAFEHCFFSHFYVGPSLKHVEGHIFKNCSALGLKNPTGPEGFPNEIDIYYGGTREQWDAISGIGDLYSAEENPRWTPFRPGGISPDEMAFFAELSTVLHPDAHALTLRDCMREGEEQNNKGGEPPRYCSAGETITVIPQIGSGAHLSGWKLMPAVEFNQVNPDDPNAGITFIMPDFDLYVEPDVDYSNAGIPIADVALNLELTDRGVPVTGTVTGETDAHYTLVSSVWYKAKEDPYRQGCYEKADDVTVFEFAEGQPYWLEVTVKAEKGYCFRSPTIFISGDKAERDYDRSTEDTLVLTYVCLPLRKITVENGMPIGKQARYSAETNSGTALAAVGQEVYAVPIFRSGETWGSVKGPGEQRTPSKFGSRSVTFREMPDYDDTITFTPAVNTVPGTHIIHTFLSESFVGEFVNNDLFNREADDVAKPGDRITIRAAYSASYNGYQSPGPGWMFDHWEIYDDFHAQPGNGEGHSSDVLIENPYANLTYITMPDHEIFVEAVYTKSQEHSFSVKGGHIVGGAYDGRDFAYLEAGETVTLAPNKNNDFTFGGWQANTPDVAIHDSTFTMPNHDVVIRAVSNSKTQNTIRVLGGVAQNIDLNVPAPTAGQGDNILLIPDELGADRKITGFQCISGNVEITADNTFIMGNAPVVIRAVIHTHTWGPWESTPDGHTRKCTGCGDEDTAPKLHVYGVPEMVEENGSLYEVRTCAVCGYQHRIEMPPVEHTHAHDDIWHSDAVSHWHICTDCGAQTDFAAHDFGQWEKEQTTGSDNFEKRTCRVCGYTETRFIPSAEDSDNVKDAFGETAVTILTGSDAAPSAAVNYNQEAAQTIAGQTAGALSVILNVDSSSTAANSANEAQAEAVSNHPGTVVDISLKAVTDAGETEISSFGAGGACTVKIPVAADMVPQGDSDSTTVFRIEEDGSLTAMKDVRFVEENGQWYVVWTSESHSLYMITRSDLYGRSYLTAEEKQAYDLVHQGVARGDDVIDLSACGLMFSQLNRVMTFYLNDHPEQYWLLGGYRYSYSGSTVMAVAPNYDSGLDESAFRAGAQKLLSAAKGIETDYGKAQALHDALVKHVTYIETGTKAHTAYGAIAQGQAVCEGYARAYQYLLQQVGIQSYVVTGTAGGGGHAWNLVRLNGRYYYTDPTWDDPIGGSEKDKPVFYGYFNLPEAQMDDDHTFGPMFASIKPVADSSEMMYDGYAAMKQLDPSKIANNFRKLNSEGSELVSRVYFTGSGIDSWLSSRYTDVADAAHIRGGYSVSWYTCGREIYLTYRLSVPQSNWPMEGQGTKPAPTRPTNGCFGQAAATSASRIKTEGVTVYLQKNIKAGFCMAAIYNEDDRFVSFGAVPISKGTDKVTIHFNDFDTAEAKTIKLFLVDSQYKSLYKGAMQNLTR